jgi:hypothetical protein
VVVGKGLSERGEQLSLVKNTQEISKISLVNHLIKNTATKNSVKSATLNKNDMSVSKIVENLTFRLPRTIKPLAYNLLLHPDLTNKSFSGNVKIDVEIIQQVPFIALHSKYLNITNVKLMKHLDTLNGLEGMNIKNSFEYEKYEYFVIEPESALASGNYTIDLDFNGSLQGKIVGFYGSTYTDKEKNQTR